MAGSSIASCGRSCGELFRRLRSTWSSADPTTTAHITSTSIKAESNRFDLWANNIAALQDAYLPTSLEYRIREDNSAKVVIEKALAYLEESLELALEIVSGERPNESWEETAVLDDKTGETATTKSSEMMELYLSVQEAVTNLFRLSMIIRKKPERDEYVKASARYQIDPTSDIVHVGDKYPTAKKSDLPWLMKRMGISITQRRQYLLYRREHQQRMQEAHKMKLGPDGHTVWSGTKASTYLPDEGAVINPEDHVFPVMINLEPSQKRPQTEYADSSRGKDGAMDFLRTPPLPMRQDRSRVGYGEYFECPYCWRVQIVMDKYEWKKHVLSDLKPYVCTYELCELNMFNSQNDWFIHELQFHRKQWRCAFCKERSPESRPDLMAHLDTEHQKDLNGQILDNYAESCQVERIDASECPLCTEYGDKLQKVNKSSKCDVSLKQFQQHLGVHMQQLALAALPQNDTEEPEDIENSDIESIRSRASDDKEDESNFDGLDLLNLTAAKGKDLYGILGLRRNATIHDIQRAYNPPDIGSKSQEDQLDIDLAFYVLRDPRTRAKYDSIHFSTPAQKTWTGNEVPFRNPYEILGIDEDADSKTISRAFEKAMKDHPDAASDDTDSAGQLIIIKWAFEQLNDPALRSICDNDILTQKGKIANDAMPISDYNDSEHMNSFQVDGDDGNILNVDGDEAKLTIRFTDAVGRRYSFPLYLCQDLGGMEHLIKQAFEHVEVNDLKTHVDARRYDLLAPDGKIIEPGDWEKTIRSGLAIRMKMWLTTKCSRDVLYSQIAQKAEEQGWVGLNSLEMASLPERPELPPWASKLVRNLSPRDPDLFIEGNMIQCHIDIYTQLPVSSTTIVKNSRDYVTVFIPRVQCSDCPGKWYDFGPGKTLDNFRAHVGSEPHLLNAPLDLPSAGNSRSRGRRRLLSRAPQSITSALRDPPPH